MAEHSAIEWTDATWNPITGCTLVSEGCRRCYAALLAATRLKNHPSRAGLARINAAGEAKFTGEVRFNEQWLDQPLRWRRPRNIFVCAHGDLFHPSVPDEWIDRVFAVMALAQQHTLQVLTKRPERARAYIEMVCLETNQATCGRFSPHMYPPHPPNGWTGFDWPLPNVLIGTSCEDQPTADERIPHLLATPAAVRFVSLEPLLGPIDLDRHLWVPMSTDELPGHAINDGCTSGRKVRRPGLDWVIVGGESGRGARPMHPDWVRSIRDQCQAAGVPFFFKQWGEWAVVDDLPSELAESLELEDRYAHVFSRRSAGVGRGGQDMQRVGKKWAGRELDGRTWDQMPATLERVP